VFFYMEVLGDASPDCDRRPRQGDYMNAKVVLHHQEKD